MSRSDIDLNKLVGLNEPDFSTTLLHQALRAEYCTAPLDFSPFQMFLSRARLPESNIHALTLMRNGHRERLVHGRALPPLQVTIHADDFTVALGFHLICEEPVTTTAAKPIRTEDEYAFRVLVAPDWRIGTLKECLEPHTDILLSYTDLQSFLGKASGVNGRSTVTEYLWRHLENRQRVTPEQQLADWLPFTLDRWGTPAHWALLENLRGFFLDPDPVLTWNDAFLGFSFQYEGGRGWLAFHENLEAFQTGQNVALILSLPDSEYINHNDRIYLADNNACRMPVSEDRSLTHWEISYDLNWTHLEDWAVIFDHLFPHAV